jgi:hypothetical protein
MNSGVVVAGGSDAPIESCSPLIGIHDAIERRSRSSADGEQYRPEECLSFSEALWMYTVGSAYAAQCESDLGRLENGFAADFVILDRTVLENSSSLKDLEPRVVVVGGCVTSYQGASFLPSDYSAATPGDFIPGKNGGRSDVLFDINAVSPGHGWSSCKCCRITQETGNVTNNK